MGRVKTEDMCQWAKCKSTRLAWEVIWSTNCRKHETEKYCEKHARRISSNRGDTFTCECKPNFNLYFYDIKKLIPAVDGTAYQDARKAWLDHGWLADKDKMVDAVTLTVPAEWDVYGSIMTSPPKAKTSILRQNIAFGLTIGMLIAAMSMAFFGGVLITALILG